MNAGLIRAATRGNTEKIIQLIAQGAEVNTSDAMSRMPLHWAAFYGYADAALALIAHQANVDATDEYRNTPLHLAVQEGHPEIIKILIQHGATVDAKNLRGSTPLHVAACWGRADAANILLQHHANADEMRIFGFTPLHLAAQSTNRKLIKIFATSGIDQFSTEKPNRFFLSQQRSYRNFTALDYLKKCPTSFAYTPGDENKKTECSGVLVDERSEELRMHALLFHLARLHYNGMYNLRDIHTLETEKEALKSRPRDSEGKYDQETQKELDQINHEIGLGIFFKMDPYLQTHTMTFLAPNPERFTLAESQRAVRIVESAPWPVSFDRKRKREEPAIEDKKDKGKEKVDDEVMEPSTKRRRTWCALS